MNIFVKGVLFGVVAVLILDTVGSIMSKRYRFPYTKLSSISFLLWATAGAFASQGGTPDLIKSIGLGWIAGLLVGLIDSTLGWWISWQVGPGRLRPESTACTKIARIVFRVTMLAAAVGAFGALIVGSLAKLIGHSGT